MRSSNKGKLSNHKPDHNMIRDVHDEDEPSIENEEGEDVHDQDQA